MDLFERTKEKIKSFLAGIRKTLSRLARRGGDPASRQGGSPGGQAPDAGDGAGPETGKDPGKKKKKGLLELPFGSPTDIIRERYSIVRAGTGTGDEEENAPKERRIGFDAGFFFRSLLRLGIAAFALGTIIYFGYHAYRSVFPGITTSDVRRISETYSCRGTAYLLRDEERIKMPAEGFADYAVGNGERVAKGDLLCSIYKTDRSDTRELIESLDSELALLRKSAGGGVSSEGILSTSAGIKKDYSEIMSALSSGGISSAGILADGFREKLDRQLCLTGRSSGITERISRVTKQRADAVESLGTPAATLRASGPGYFFRSSDGYEEVFDLSLARDLTAEALRAAIASEPDPGAAGCAGTLAPASEWYLAVLCDSPEMKKAVTGRDYYVTLSDDDCIRLEMRLEKKIADGDGLLLLFAGKTIPRECSWLRCQNVSIEYLSVDGYRVPAEAVVSHEGMTGVYTVNSGFVTFRRINVIAEGPGYKVAEPYETAESGAPVVTRYIGYGTGGVIDNTAGMRAFAAEKGLSPVNGREGGIDFLRGAGYLRRGERGYSALTMKKLPSGRIPLRFGEANTYYYMLNITDEMITSGKKLYHGKVLS